MNNAVILFDTKDKFKKIWERWCKKYNVDLVTGTIDGFDSYDKYEKMLVVKNNAIPNWKFKNPFDIYDTEFCAVIDNEDLSQIWKDINFYSEKEELKNIKIHLADIYSSDVLFITKEHLSILKEAYKLSENTSFINNVVLSMILLKENTNVKTLDITYNILNLVKNDWLQHNWQLQIDQSPFFIKYGHIWNFNLLEDDISESIISQLWNNTNTFYE